MTRAGWRWLAVVWLIAAAVVVVFATAAVAQALHFSTARVEAALQPLFAAGRADSSSPLVAAAARSLDVSTPQLFAALRHAKVSLAPGS